jgi:hypothetical protein
MKVVMMVGETVEKKVEKTVAMKDLQKAEMRVAWMAVSMVERTAE